METLLFVIGVCWIVLGSLVAVAPAGVRMGDVFFRAFFWWATSAPVAVPLGGALITCGAIVLLLCGYCT